MTCTIIFIGIVDIRVQHMHKNINKKFDMGSGRYGEQDVTNRNQKGW